MPRQPNKSLAALEALIAAADEAGVPVPLLRAAARALVDLEDELAAVSDPRKVATLEKARRLLAAHEAGATRAQCIERYGIGKSTYGRLLRLARTSRAISSGDSAATE